MRPAHRLLVIMVKEARAGRVKTRLARAVGQATALRFYRSASAAVIGRLAADRRWTTWLAVDPDTRITSRTWPSSVPRIGQGRGDLGRRLQRLLDHGHPGPLLIVGSDIPAIRPAHIWAAFRVLGDNDAVLGPALDGGYWLIGRRQARRRLAPRFPDVRWSTEHALTDTVDALAGARIGYGPGLADVDDSQDLARVTGWAGRRTLPAIGATAASARTAGPAVLPTVSPRPGGAS